MNFNSKRSVTDEQNERHKRLLASILKEEGNKSCADCKTRNPTWASVNLGVFVCLTCSGIHRSLGVHISQVRSCNLDTWLPKQVEFCRIMGNVKGNRYWEARLPKDFRRPPSGNPNPELASFIRAKYVDQAFAATDSPPPTIDNYVDNPYAKDAEGSGSGASTAAPAAAGPGLSLRTTPAKASASSPALTTDLLGGFDELAAGPSPLAASAQAAPPAAASNADPFGYGSFVSAATASSAPSIAQRNSLEWSDFHAAAPPSSATAPSLPALLNQTSGHHRSYSEGLPSTAGPSAGPTASSSGAQHGPSRLSGAAAGAASSSGSGPGAAHGNHVRHSSRSQLDPFAVSAAPDDLLAGLTIHHVMESLGGPPSASASAGGALPSSTSLTGAAAADPFAFATSSTPADHALPAPGAGHKRHPSRSAKPTGEEILRLFDHAPSTAGGGAAVSDDPFGDFLSGPPAPSNGMAAALGGTSFKHAIPATNGLGSAGGGAMADLL
ncbi:hypothetical protein HYH03_005056 [Edaphochlamys debaryana]|uniref:Arf-GAP domain-containing protein n=1 Tax=Edaphochlamys debaryana TaxID=47281 RepID=A0A835Y6S0_9CHLO|nr:hypothetical protein HYH03_005056 [Edaphochlamys debaryana]|eukprot:KAG2497058.1 hypothetical protein HYH03_005056 [Edaphochlamys debaryana]